MVLKLYPALMVCLVLWISVEGDYTENDAREYLDNINKLYLEEERQQAIAEWAYSSNITEDTTAEKDNAEKKFDKFEKGIWEETIKFEWRTFQDEDLYRQFKFLSNLWRNALPDDDLKAYLDLKDEMSSIQDEAKMCAYREPSNCEITISDLNDMVEDMTDPEELKHYYKEWRRVAGKQIRPLFPKYVDYVKESATANHFDDVIEYWLDDFDTEGFEEQIEKLWKQIRPLYLEIHAYLRRRLRERYGEKAVPKNEPIPAHLLGTMVGAVAPYIHNFTKPYPEIEGLNVTELLIQQNYAPLQMYKLADDFLQSINLIPMPQSFWDYSIFTQPTDRQVDSPGVFYLYEPEDDVRVIQVTNVTDWDYQQSFVAVGAAEEVLQYATNQKYIVYQNPPNPGFQGLLGNLMTLSAFSTQYLTDIGLLSDYTYTTEEQLNDLFYYALTDVAGMAGYYSLELWRWKVFKGDITEENYNSEWWKLCTNIQGTQCPVEISEDDFDPGSVNELVTGDTPITTFVFNILNYQFLEALCIQAGQYDPENPDNQLLIECNLYGNTDVGNTLGEMLKLGSSKPWADALEIVTGQRNMDAGPLLRFFDPLYKWLKEQNDASDEIVGWDLSDDKNAYATFRV